MAIKGGSGADRLRGKVGDDVILGLGGNDVLYGGQSEYEKDTLQGGEGDDRLSNGLSYFGIMDGGAGVDTFVVEPSGNSNLSDIEFRSIERLEFQAPIQKGGFSLTAEQFGAGKIATDAVIDGLYVSSAAPGTSISISSNGQTLLDFSRLRFENWGVNDHLSIYGSTGNDRIFGSASTDFIYGGDGNDAIVMGGASALAPVGDTAFGGGGNDVVSISAGKAALYGEAHGGEGVDTFRAFATRTDSVADLTKTIVDQFEALTLDGRASAHGVDARFTSSQLSAGFTANAVVRGSGEGSSETLTVQVDGAMVDLSGLRFSNWHDAGASADTVKIIGSWRRDVVIGTARADLIDGGGTGDSLKGGKGDDTLIGGEGDDKLYGGVGDDVLTGGQDRDAFVFDTLSDVDTITDFSHSDDTIWLDRRVFTAFARGEVSYAEAVDHLRYDDSTGGLFYDADGAAGPGAAVRFATLQPGLGHEIDQTDVFII